MRRLWLATKFVFASCILSLMFFFFMFPVSGWAEPNQSNQKKVQGKLDDRQILIYWNELEKAKKGIGIEISRSGIQTQDQAAEESFKKKYQLTDEDIEEIKQKGGNQDFQSAS